MMKDVHSLECSRCKMRERFYAEFNCDPKRNVAYFGIISYTDYYYLMPVPSEEPKEKISTEAQCRRQSNVILHLKDERTDKQKPIKKKKIQKPIKKKKIQKPIKKKKIQKPIRKKKVQKPIKKKKKLIKHYFNDDKNLVSRCVEKTPDSNIPFCLQKHACNFISVKKSESFHESSSDDNASSDNLETTNNKLTKKNPSKKKVGAKVPKLGTLKRKRWNWDKLQPNESYEDDLFEEKKLKHIRLEKLDCTSKGDSYSTPCWSVQLSPKELSMSPSYEDCYSPSELQTFRKDAEEYQYRRSKRRKIKHEKTEDSKTEMKEQPESYRILEEVKKRLEKLSERDCGFEEDFYFANEGEPNQEAEL